MMANLILERHFDEALTPEAVREGGLETKWCFDLHRVLWHGSFLSRDGHTMICWFSAPDLESARLALRDPDTDLSRFWSGTVHRGAADVTPTVVVERSFAAPVQYEDIAALEEAKPWCFEMHRVTYSHTFFSLDRKRMLCFYAAPDADSVREAQKKAGMPVNAVWACSMIPGWA